MVSKHKIYEQPSRSYATDQCTVLFYYSILLFINYLIVPTQSQNRSYGARAIFKTSSFNWKLPINFIIFDLVVIVSMK